MSGPSTTKRRRAPRRARIAAVLLTAVWAGFAFPVHAEVVGYGVPAGFSLCEATQIGGVEPRPGCEAADIRFQADTDSAVPSSFGFAIASGYLNGDDLEDLVVGDPERNRVYVFFGRGSVTASYGLDPETFYDREVSSETQADVIFESNDVTSLGFSLAIGRERIDTAECPPGDRASALVIGAPGPLDDPPSEPGTVFYIPAGALCLTPSDPPAPVTIDPGAAGQAVRSPVVENDEFGYSVALGRLLDPPGTNEDLIVGARTGAGGAGSVTIFPVTDGVVATGLSAVARVEAAEGDGLGEVIAVGDLDLDFDADEEPFGDVDDLAVGAVGHETGKVLMVQGPLATDGGRDSDGIYREEDPEVAPVLGEEPGDFFGFSVAISGQGLLAVGAIFADNTPPSQEEGEGGNPLTNVLGTERINAGKVYVWSAGVFHEADPDLSAITAAQIFVGRRSGDQAGFALAFADLDDAGSDDLVFTARHEDGSGLRVNEIDQGTAYVRFDALIDDSPVDLNQCAVNSDCTGVGGTNVMIFGGDREDDQSDEIGFAAAAGDFNGDGTDDLFLSSLTHRRVYATTLQDSDDDRETEGRNLRDDDDDEDGDPDSTDCAPLDPEIFAGAEEIACNGIDENCNGDDDEAPDMDSDGFDACGGEGTPADCDDEDPLSNSGAQELCDGNDNDCSGSVPLVEQDVDGDGWVECADWDDVQGDNPEIMGSGDCNEGDADSFPGAAPNESPPDACMTDADGDDYGDNTPIAGVTAGTDCDDGSASTFPGAAQTEPISGACMEDEDDDGYGDIAPRAGVTPGTDCRDRDPNSFPGAAELCDGDDNSCTGTVPGDELDIDGDGYVACAGWDDTQGNQPNVVGGGDCDEGDAAAFPGAAPNETAGAACMRDADGDDYGDIQPGPGVTPGTDCDDSSPVTFQGAAEIEAPANCMKDEDGDGYGDSASVLPVVAGGDCDDTDAAAYPSAEELPDDGIDQDCNGFDSVTCFVDGDRDGYGSLTSLLAADGDCDDDGESPFDTDCDDADDLIHPGVDEIPDDGIDQDCNGFDTVTCILDADTDGFGTALGTETLADDGTCDTEQQESTSSDDCDDSDPDTYPGAPELCDGNNNSCGGAVPGDESDADGDGYVACADWNDAQGDDPGVAGGGDCDETSATTFPGAAPNEAASTACMKDADGDDYGDALPPAGVVAGTDCDDGSTVTFPGAAEVEAPLNCMRDADDDGFGDGAVSLPVVAGADCDDADTTTWPGAPQLCDGNDNTCSGSVPADEIDVDGDTFVACDGWNDAQGDDPGVTGGGDCDETDGDTFPGAAPNEAVPGACLRDKDGDDFGDLTPPAGVLAGSDCDDASAVTFVGAAEIEAPLNCMRDADDDGYGDDTAVLPVVPGHDCADDDGARNPGVLEGPDGDPVCTDSLDNDCDDLTDGDDPGCQPPLPCPDDDSDGFADCVSQPLCDATGLVCGDCDDSAPAVNPGQAEICDGIDNDCADGIDEDFDADSDGFTTCELPVADCDDGNAAVNPGATEICADATDNDCDPGTPDLFDADSDGASCEADCDDADPALNLDDADLDTYTTCDGDCNDGQAGVNPGASEVCNDGVDNDCNPATLDLGDSDSDGAACDVDCDDADPALNLQDADSDMYTTCDGDCDDADPAVNPLAEDVCDGVDNNCDGTIDEDFDLDSDGFSSCGDPADCNDGNPDVNPGADEICNDGVNNDCDDGTPDLFDADSDGASCDADCDDADGASYPGASELCDGNDNDCDTVLPADETDADSDGFVACASWADIQGDDPEILGGGDCDATDTDTFPGAAPNEPFATACMRDADGDDYGDQTPPPGVTSGTDCDDGSAVTFPGAAEIEAPLNCMRDFDDDGYGDEAVAPPVVPGTDCADDDATRFPGAPETCGDGVDSDCDGSDPPCPGRVPRAERTLRSGGTDRSRQVVRPRSRGEPIVLSATDGGVLRWSEDFGAIGYDVYRGDVAALRAHGDYTQDPAADGPAAERFCAVNEPLLDDSFTPAPGRVVFYLVSSDAASDAYGLGTDSNGRPRPNANPCPDQAGEADGSPAAGGRGR